MATLEEITQLISGLALQLKAQPPTEECEQSSSLDLSIAKLTQSLNLHDDDGASTSRVLDTALSLMCFKAPQVFDSVLEYTVKTIASVLSSSVGCKVFRLGKEDVLRVGSSISRRDCFDLIDVVGGDTLSDLEERGVPSRLLLHALLRAAVSAPSCRYLDPSMVVLDADLSARRSIAASKLVSHLPVELSSVKDKVPLRLLLWFLDPLILKRDISEMLQETMNRPFLSLPKELHERKDWHSILICLVLSPAMFTATRALLHDWFLLTGLRSILQLLIDLVSVVLDVISIPTRSLAGPISSEGLLQIVNWIIDFKQPGPSINPSAAKVAFLDHKSLWSLAISFPSWFYFASVLVFADKSFKEVLYLEGTVGENAAVRYLAWILNPFDKTRQDLLSGNLIKLARHWTSKQVVSSVQETRTLGLKRRLKKPKVDDISKEGFTFGNQHGCQAISLWLQEYQNTAYECDFDPQVSMFFRWIPLGIFTGWCSSDINESGCEFLLHYAATGTMLHSVRRNEGFAMKDAIAGASLVFNLTDIVDRMSESLFETVCIADSYICKVKSRTARYLIKCVQRLTQPDASEVAGVQTLLDLVSRLEKWRTQGQEVALIEAELENAIHVLKSKFSST
ncbi:unnamed protein product [Linum tenue]|uniref:Uncharacterized protein n=1 Tax=Linum tenue TaxID=586396 RepID=A0AAV0S974_9ROSI|nr:unnamed protein product [Linum tenue]